MDTFLPTSRSFLKLLGLLGAGGVFVYCQGKQRLLRRKVLSGS